MNEGNQVGFGCINSAGGFYMIMATWGGRCHQFPTVSTYEWTVLVIMEGHKNVLDWSRSEYEPT